MADKKRVLWISERMPYDGVTHAGGKDMNYYLKKINEKGTLEITVIAFSRKNELSKIDLGKYNIDYHAISYPDKGIKKIAKQLFDIESVINPWNRNGTLTRNFEERAIVGVLKKLRAQGYKPDSIILQWTQIILLSRKIKEFFPGVPLLGIEVDVAYLGFERKARIEENRILKKIKEIQYKNLKKRELSALSELSLIAVNNYKDRNLLIKDNISRDKIIQLSVYFDNYSGIQREPDFKSLVFFGAMGRPENWKSAIWFIENVMPRIKDLDLSLYVVGNNPPEKLRNLSSSRVVVTGYVENVEPFFEKALCMVCPLLLGAGIKVKVLEGLSAGLPVLANEIAIEGIKATDREDYIKCSSPEEYEEAIRLLFSNKEYVHLLGNNARQFINHSFNLLDDVDRVYELINQGFSMSTMKG